MHIRFGRASFSDAQTSERLEWIVTNGIGGYAMGTAPGMLTRRYHGLLVAATRPPVERVLLVPKIDESAMYGGREYALATTRWSDGTIDPHGHANIESFVIDAGAPAWRFACADAIVEKRLWMAHEENTTCVRYALVRAQSPLRLALKVFGDGRDHHGTTHAGGQPALERTSEGVRFTAPGARIGCDLSAERAAWQLDGAWYYRFDLARERERGLESDEDHFCAAIATIDLAEGDECTVTLSAVQPPAAASADRSWRAFAGRKADVVASARSSLPRAHAVPGWVEQIVSAADQFLVRGERGPTVIAGYPWFTDWGRDTMIALPGLTIATGRYDVARTILETFARSVDQGMIPNRFVEAGDAPEYNTVDATLLFLIAIGRYVVAKSDAGFARAMAPVIADIIDWHERGTRFGIKRDPIDGLLAAGAPGIQLTWMDAKSGDDVITPRMGKPVEVNAFWIDALRAASRVAAAAGTDGRRYDRFAEEAKRGFARFWDEKSGYCFDVIDGPNGDDASLRPNQLFAFALDEPLLDKERARKAVDRCAGSLLTSYGLRTLAPDDPRYTGRYAGDPRQRDAAYHQGTVWCWLLAPFALAHFRAYGDAQRAAAYLEPLADALFGYGLGTLGEIFDGDPPHEPRGCIAQAWSVGQSLWAWTTLAREMER